MEFGLWMDLATMVGHTHGSMYLLMGDHQDKKSNEKVELTVASLECLVSFVIVKSR